MLCGKESGTVLSNIPYVTIWDGGISLETNCDLDIKTGEVTNIGVVNAEGLESCERQYIILQGEQTDVYEDEHGFAYWADIEGIYDDSPDDDSDGKTRCINGELNVGDLVLSTPGDDYKCLVGRVMQIDVIGTPEHETDNTTDDVHVNFAEADYAPMRVTEIEEMFTELYKAPKIFEECPLDDAIMGPDCLIRITDVHEDTLKELLSGGYAAACYCYNILAGQSFEG
jgi:hypothetical protein